MAGHAMRRIVARHLQLERGSLCGATSRQKSIPAALHPDPGITTRSFTEHPSARPAASTPPPSANVREELRAFKDRLRPLGPGLVDLSLEDGTGLASLVLNNHDRRNALSGKMMVQLSDAVDTLESWDRGVALILQGEGGTFCAGADLALARDHLVTAADGRLMSRLMTDTLERLRRLPLISVAVIDGNAVGGGAELSTCCDFRVAGPESIVRFVQVKMGVSTGWGGGARLTSIIGRRAALRLLAWGTPVSANEGLVLGLFDAVAGNVGGTKDEALRLLEGILKREAHGAVRAMKSVVAAADHIPTDVRFTEQGHFSSMWGGGHNRSALEASKTTKR